MNVNETIEIRSLVSRNRRKTFKLATASHRAAFSGNTSLIATFYSMTTNRARSKITYTLLNMTGCSKNTMLENYTIEMLVKMTAKIFIRSDSSIIVVSAPILGR